MQLGVPTDVDDTKLKKAYRKAAMQVRFWNVDMLSCSYSLSLQYHPDKNSSPEAEEKFKEIRCGKV